MPAVRLWLHDLIPHLVGSDIQISVAPAAKGLVSDGKARIAVVRAGRSLGRRLRAGVESGDGEQTNQHQRCTPFPQPELFCNLCTHLLFPLEVRDEPRRLGLPGLTESAT